MSLPKIELEQTVEIPAVAAEQFNEGYIVLMLMSTNDDQGQNQDLSFRIRPYNQEAGKLYPSQDKDFEYVQKNIWMLAYQSPVFAQFLIGMMPLVNALIKKNNAEGVLNSEADEETKASAQVKLDEAKAALGIV